MNHKVNRLQKKRVAVSAGGGHGLFLCCAAGETGCRLLDGVGGERSSFGIFLASGVGRLRFREAVTASLTELCLPAVRDTSRLPVEEMGRLFREEYPVKKNTKPVGGSATLLTLGGDGLRWESVGTNRLYLKRNGRLWLMNLPQSERSMGGAAFHGGEVTLPEVLKLAKKEKAAAYLSAEDPVGGYEKSVRPFTLKAGDCVLLCSFDAADALGEQALLALLGDVGADSAEAILSAAEKKLNGRVPGLSAAVIVCKKMSGASDQGSVRCAKATVFSDRGCRPNNEDSVLMTEDTWAVADGLGGHAKGEVASAMAVELVKRAAEEGIEPTGDGMRGLIGEINESIIANRKGSDMRTTLTAAFLRGGQLSYISVGDCRLYRICGGDAALMTRDDSLAEIMLRKGMITGDLRDSEYQSKLRRVLGSEDSGSAREENIGMYAAHPGEGVFICSDGFWEHIYDEEIGIDFSASATPEDWVERMLRRVVLRVNERSDNLSCAAVIFE